MPKEEPEDVALPPNPIPTREEADNAAKERKASLKSITDIRRAFAWQLHRWPIDKNVVWERTKIHLPRTYLAREGEDLRAIYEGTDLNQFVYQHYLDHVDPKYDTWVNYVSPDHIVSRRHEFLGPDPRVAGYFFDVDGEVHIRWWDGFLNDQWMDTQKWKIDVTKDEEGKWVENIA